MAAYPSDKSKWQSRFGGGWLNGGQFLAESMVARKARKEKVDLPHRFWDKPRWKKEFLIQLRLANSLLKLYSPEAIIRALRTKEGGKAFSFGAPFLDALFKDEQEKWEREQAKLAETSKKNESVAQEELCSDSSPRSNIAHKPSLLNKLRELNG